MDNQRVVRTVEALFCLALDQRGKPEGETALARGTEWFTRHGVSPALLSRRANIAIATLAPHLLPPQSAPPRPAPPPPRPAPPRRREYATWRPHVDTGTCEHCGARFARGKFHQGMKARYCSPTCHEAKRREDSKRRMAEMRARRKAERS